MKILDISGKYRLRAEFLDVGPERFQEVLNHADSHLPFGILRTSEHRKRHPNTYPYKDGCIEAVLPGDVICALVENDLMKEPLDEMNAKDTQWLCDLSWWFMKEFEVPEELLENDEVHLFLEMLDFKTDIILNGIPVGHHTNAFYPFDQDVKKYLKKGMNRLVIRITSGTEDFYIQDSVMYYCATDDGTKNQRAYLRKPQYTYGWDWCQSVPTCGIGGRMELQGISGARVSACRVDTVTIGENEARLDLFLEIDKVDMVCADDAVLNWEIFYQGETVASGQKDLYLAGGLNFIHEDVRIAEPHLWWPNGYGEPALYTLKTSIDCRSVINEMEPVRFGIRTVEMRQERIDEDQRTFEFVINGVSVFCKGGNWVPPDSVYLRITKEKYQKLVEEARALNFNMLRVWGGGLYEPDCFYEYCSENGILVLQDFMYSCAYYPDHLEWFVHEAQKEAEYQTKRLAHYPCMAAWTGNNEIAESWRDWWQGILHSEYDYGKRIYNYIQPKIVMSNSPKIPYMPSCPYFGNFSQNVKDGKVEGMSNIPRWGKHANNPLCGDVHAWNYFLNDPYTRYTPETIFETFDIFPARFCSEYGFYGPLTAASMKRATGLSELSFTDPAWLFHGEKPEKHQMVLNAIQAMFMDTDQLSVEEYLLYGGITQGILYEQLTDAMRIKKYGSGFLIWMFDDAWPEMGWTVIDYYLERKISYYFMKRAFQHRKLVLRTAEEQSVLTVMNETDQAMDTEIVYGGMRFDGSQKTEKTLAISLESHQKTQIVLPLKKEERLDFVYAYAKDGSAEPCTDLRPYYRRYPLSAGQAEILSEKPVEGGMEITVTAHNYVPCAYLTTDNEIQNFSDNYFTLLPGEVRTVYTEKPYKELKIRTADVKA